MFGFIKKNFFITIAFFSCNELKCVSMNNQSSKIRPEIININSNEPSFYSYSILVNQCSGSCNNSNDRYVRLCASGVVKIMNIKAFNLMSRTNETSYIERHETCECKCRVDASNLGVTINSDVSPKN